jgi:glycosyltransferase involved in cell wall biosynthesis
MGKAAREYVLKNFDSKVLGKQLEKIYREAL